MKRFAIPVLACMASILGCSDPAPTTGALIVDIAGLPAGVVAAVQVTGPATFQRALDQTTTLSELPPGEYMVRASLVTNPTARYQPALGSQTVAVVAGQTASASVAYALASGSIALTVSGLPANVAAAIRIIGEGITRVATASGTVGALPPGNYDIVADTFSSNVGDRFGAAVFSQPLTIDISPTPVAVSVTYGIVSGTLNVPVSGIASGPSNLITVTGPGGFVRTASSSTTYRGLTPGTYEVAANTVSACPSVYTPSVPRQVHAVVAGQTVDAPVAYSVSSPSPANLNLKIADAFLVQTVQRSDGLVPIVAGRPALLRVFATANQCNSATPVVKVKFSNGDSVMVNAPQGTMPQSVSMAPLAMSWNAFLPAEKVQPGLTFSAEIDPGNAVPEADETDNRYPATSQKSAGVVDVPPLNLTFVPVVQSGVTGDVHAGNTNLYLAALNEMLPFSQRNVTVAAPMTSQVTLGNGGAAQFQAILQEVETRRLADGAGTQVNYYGVIRPAPSITFLTYGGMAYVPGQSAVGIQVGWFSNQRQATELVAHELSHSFGRYHAPCGAAGGPDQAYPYPGGTIGAYGYDTWNASDAMYVNLKGPQTPDIMGYCQLPWVSDYTFHGILNFRGPVVAASVASPNERVSTILVSGRMDRSGISVDPVFALQTRPALPTGSGPYAIEGRDASGAVVFRTSFTPVRTDHGDPAARFFAFAIPLAATDAARLHEVRVVGGGFMASSRSSTGFARMRASGMSDPGVSIVRRARSAVEVRWNASDWPAVLIRHPVDGSLLAIGRNGRALVVTDQPALDLVLSDGAQSLAIRAAVSPH